MYNFEVIQLDLLKALPKLPKAEEYVATMTKTVTKRHIKLTKALGIGMDDPVKMKIEPKLIRNFCHWNCCFMRDLFPHEFEVVMGYNLTACPCGAMYYLELHSVLRTEDKYVDFTSDHMGESEKWFIPVFVLEDGRELVKIMRYVKSNAIEKFSSKNVHQCPCLSGGHWTFTYPDMPSIDLFREQVQVLRNKFGKQ
jgi:hypothetical protein